MRIQFALLSFLSFCYYTVAEDTVPAVRVVRFQIDYPNAKTTEISHVRKWNSLLRSSVLASLRFINKHWLICGGTELEKKANDCGKAQVTGEAVSSGGYRINVTMISERDPIRNAKVEATSTVFGVVQIGLKGGIFQYTNSLKVLGKPSQDLPFDEAFFCYRGATLLNGDRCHLCSPGTYQSEDSDHCSPCEKGTYQPLSGRTSCLSCSQHKTTAREGTENETECIPTCPAGYFYDGKARICEACGLRGYQPDTGADSCVPCPEGHVAAYRNSTSIDHCLENCPPGSERSTELQCTACPIGAFKGSADQMCMMCPQGTTTVGEGADSLEECRMEICTPGSFLDPLSSKCVDCPHGFYSSQSNERKCTKCPEAMTTYRLGATSSSECRITDQCKAGSHKCHWLAVCFDLPDTDNTPRYSCKCRPGFVGNGYNCTDACDSLCLNDGECVKTRDGSTKCVCKAGFLGRRCEKKIF